MRAKFRARLSLWSPLLAGQRPARERQPLPGLAHQHILGHLLEQPRDLCTIPQQWAGGKSTRKKPQIVLTRRQLVRHNGSGGVAFIAASRVCPELE